MGLRKSEMEMVLKQLANLHAASAVDYERNGPFDVKFSRGVYNIEMKEMFESNYDAVTFIIDECFSTWPNLNKRIVDKMVKV